jgi:DNA topoisomerase-6 subunit B
MINTKHNTPDVVGPALPDDYIIWDEKEHGTRVEVNLNGRYISAKQSVYEYLRQTAIVNPHTRITFVDPEGRTTVFARAWDKLPPVTKDIKPHPEGLELGTLMNLGRASRTKNLRDFLRNDFSRVSDRLATEIVEKSGLKESAKTAQLGLEQYKALLGAMQSVKYIQPQTDCLSPIGEALIRKGLKNVLEEVKPEFYAPPVTRSPRVFAGNPFQVEVGIVYGGSIPSDQPVTLLRFANRVPLLYQQGACLLTKSVEGVDWRRYGLEQRGGQGIPFGPAIILVHVASTKVPFTSEAKEAVASIPEIQAELELALRECGRRLKVHLNKKETKVRTKAKFEIVQEILPLIAQKSAKIVNKPVPPLSGSITKIMNVVWVDDSVTYERKRHRVRIDIFNYTPRQVRFNLHAVVPASAAALLRAEPRPAEVKEDGKITWELKPIRTTEKASVALELDGLEPELYDENELYASGIDPSMIIGADPLPGDWDVDRLKVTEMPAEPAPADEEEEEVDYDEQTEALGDD